MQLEIFVPHNVPELKAISPKREMPGAFACRTSKDVADYLREIWEGIDIYESGIVLFLNRAKVVIGWYKAGQGGITGCVMDPRLIIKKALEVLATDIILAHNHPSGNLKPSRADEELTQKIKNGAQFLEINVLDHIILTETAYLSFADECIL